MPICRYCSPFSLQDTYASQILTQGVSLQEFVETMEHTIIPCATAVCPQCGKVSLLSAGNTPSVVNTIVMWKHLRRWIDDSSQLGNEPGEAPCAEQQ